MEQTSRLSIVIDTGNAQNNLERLRTSLRGLSTDGTTASNILSRMGATGGLSNIINRVGQTNNAFRQFSQMVNNTQNNFNNFNRTVNNASTNIMRMGDTINRTTNNITRMGDTINRNITVINNYNRSLSGTHDALSRLQGILTGGMFGVFALSVAKTADSMQETHSQIKLVTKSHEEYLVVADRLHEMAGKNLKDFQATAGLYTNSARALGQLGKSQEEVLKFTNAVSLAMGVGGKSAQEQAAALYQLGQAMQSGVVQGDEFRSLAENAPIMLDLVAESLGKTRGEVRELSKEGKITAEVMYKAMADATPKLQEMFNKMPVTMSQGFSVLKNEYKKFTHEFMNGEGGISSVVAKGLIWLSKNFDTLGKVAIAGAGVAMLGFASKVKITTTAFTVLGNVIKAHPILAIATGILGVASAFYGLDDVLNTTGIIFKDLFELVTTGWNGLSDLVEAVAFNIKDEFAKSNQETSVGFGVFFEDTEKGFTGLLHGISRIVASATGVLGGFFAWLGTKTNNALLHVDNAFIDLGNSIGAVFANTSNAILDFLTSALGKTNDMISGLNQMLAKLPFGSFQIAPVDFAFGGRFQYKPMPRKTTNNATLSQHISDYVGMSVDIAGSQVGGYLQSVKQRASTSNNPPVNLNIPSQPQKPSSSDKDKKGNKDKKDEKKYNYTKDEIKALQLVQKLIYGTVFADGSTLSSYAEKNGVPAEILAGLLMQESKGFQYAKSPTGALGYFQTTSGYRKDMGMTVQDSYNLEISGKKAVDFLAKSYAEFGNWTDATRSYNAGRGGTREFNRTGKVSNKAARNREVREYVPKINRYTAYFEGNKHLSDRDRDLSKDGQDYWKKQAQQNSEQQKQRDDLIQSFQTKAQQNQKEREQLYANIQTLFAHDPTIMKDMLNKAKASHKYQDLADETRFLLDSQGHQMDKVSHLQNEHLLGVYQLFARTDIGWSDKYSLKSGLDSDFFKKYHGLMLEQKQRNLDNSEGIISPLQRLKLEKDIAIYRKRYIDRASNEEIKATEVLYDRKISIEQTQEELTKKRLVFEAKQYDMTAEDRILANANIASLELATQTELSDEIRQLHQDAITAKYKHEMAEHQKARDRILTDAKNDYERLKRVYLNQKDKYAGLRYDLQKDENNYSTAEIDAIIEQQKKKQDLQSFMDLKEKMNNTSAFKLNIAKDETGSMVELANSMNAIISSYDTVKTYRTNMLDDLKKDREAGLITQEEYNKKEADLQQQHIQSMAQLTMGGAGQFFGAISNMGKIMLGEQSSTYKEMFRISKAFYLAQAGMEVYKAGSSAFAETAGSVWVKMAAAAKAVAQSSSFVSLISAANLKGFATGGYTGNIGTSQIAGVVHGQEYVVNAKATKRIGVDNLNKLNSGGSLGGNVNNISVNVTVNADGSSNVQASHQIGKEMGQAIVAVVQNELRKEMRQGGMLDRHYRR